MADERHIDELAGNWWLIIGTPDGIHCWPLGDSDPTRSILAAKVLLGVPPGAGPMLDDTAWDVQTSPGRPHDTLLARATIHDLAELARVDVTAYRAAEADACRGEQVQAARDLLDSLDDQTIAAVLAAYGRVPAAPTKEV